VARKIPAPATPGHLVWRLAMKWRATVDREVAEFGLTHSQYSFLASLRALSAGGSHPSQRELADFSGLEPMYVSKLARALEANGLITRREHPHDPRAVQLELTRNGLTVVDKAIAKVAALHEELTAPLGGMRSTRTAETVAALRALLGDEEETPS
jgi:DNA-binding MarR family transcriptional regulator